MTRPGDVPGRPRPRTLPAQLRSAYHAARYWVVQPRNRVPVAILVVALLAGSLVAALSLRGGSSHPVAAVTPVSPPRPQTSTALSKVAGTTSTPNHKKTATTAHAAAPFHCGTGGTGSSGSAAGSEAPARICIPGIHVDATVMRLGLNPDHTVQVPPLSRVGDAGWYQYSAAPGSVGPTVILGHIDSAQYGEGVFFHLSQLHTGNKIVVSRGDGMIATFVVTKVAEIPKTNFPTNAVYGATSGPAIRLVTCGGRFDSATRNYLDNIIAFGTLQSVRPS